MGLFAWITGTLGTLCMIMGIITATEAIDQIAELTWTFWFVLSAILLLLCIALAIGRSAYE